MGAASLALRLHGIIDLQNTSGEELRLKKRQRAQLERTINLRDRPPNSNFKFDQQSAAQIYHRLALPATARSTIGIEIKGSNTTLTTVTL